MAKPVDHRAHALALAAALGAEVSIARGDRGLLAVVVIRDGSRTTVATNATEPHNAWRWGAEHLARLDGGAAFAEARRAFERADRAEFEGPAARAGAGKAVA